MKSYVSTQKFLLLNQHKSNYVATHKYLDLLEQLHVLLTIKTSHHIK